MGVPTRAPAPLESTQKRRAPTDAGPAAGESIAENRLSPDYALGFIKLFFVGTGMMGRDPLRSFRWQEITTHMLEEAPHADPSEALTQLALKLVRAEYECIASIASVPLPRLNRSRPASTAYRSIEDVIHEWAGCARAMAMFAVNLHLITPEQAVEVVREFRAHHPNLLA